MIGKTILDRYRIDALIGEGGMSTVYRGVNTSIGKAVAIKVLRRHLARDPEVRARFKDEAHIQAQFEHPNIVSVIDFHAEDDQLFIIMEYVPGMSLMAMVSEHTGALPFAGCLEIMRQVLDAMAHAHGKGVIHRDIKPSNIVVQDMQGKTVAKVMDFGIAKIVGAAGMTRPGDKMGTLWYMSPEQVRSPADVDLKTDIYSLGVTLYEMATGRVPFDADSEYGIMDAIVRDPPPPPSAICPGINPAFEQLILRAMAKDPRQRFQSAAEFLAAMENAGRQATAPVQHPLEFGSGEISSPSYPPPGQTSYPPARSNTKIIAMIGAGSALLFVLLLVIVALVLKDSWGGSSRGGATTPPSAGTGGGGGYEPPEPEPEPYKPPPKKDEAYYRYLEGADHLWTIQIESFKEDPSRAYRLMRKLRDKDYDAFVVKSYLEDKGAYYYRVRIGRYETREQAEIEKSRIQARENDYYDAWLDH